ncbi:hypothetical protein JCM30237_16610 [Halolamina litorea]|uniref:Uncharacterized protein n=1 Tax=Halolamina litorea TaxID=1515593 RepID=A0ABD6BUL2_9EURY|nr:hypothetical protein [Halolamina litorea]
MTDDRLRTASEELRQASAATEDAEVQRRLYDQSDRIASLAAADEAPDGDTLMQHLHALGDLREATGGDVSERVDAALEAVRAVRDDGEN